VTTCGELKTATCKTVRASTPYPPVLEPGIEEIGWLFGILKVQGLTAELGNADLTDTQIRALRGFDFSLSTFGKTMPFFGNILPTLRSYSGIEYPQSQPPASFGRGEDRKSARTMGLGPRIHAGRGSAVAGRASADFLFQTRHIVAVRQPRAGRRDVAKEGIRDIRRIVLCAF
jgi:hypothetical protein